MAGNTYTWNGGSGSGGTPSNWTPDGPPSDGDTGIVNSGTLQLLDAQLNSNTLLLNAGTLQLSNDVGSLTQDDGSPVSGFDSATTLTAGNSGAAEIDVFGDFLNNGTIDAAGNTLTLSLQAFQGTTSYAGMLENAGLIEVTNGATLHVTGTTGATFQGGNVLVDNGSALVDSVNIAASFFTLDSNGTLELNSIISSSTISTVLFSGTSDLLKLDAGAFDSTVSMAGFASGDTLDIGTQAVGTIIYDYPSLGNGGPTLTVEGTTGAVLFAGSFTNANGGQAFSNTGTFTASTLASGTVAAGPFEIVTAGNGDTLLEVLPPSTWTWIGPQTGGSLGSSANWQLAAGSPGNQNGVPTAGDTAFANNATLDFGTDNQLQAVTIHATGTSEIDFIGDSGTTVVSNGFTNVSSGVNAQNPTFDDATLITNDPSAVAATTLNFSGITVNQGTIISDAAAGSSMTVNVTQDGTSPGYFINYNDIEADAGNSLTISIGGTSELFNAGLLYANGGDILVTTTGTGAIAGGLAGELGGVAVIAGGGTIEINTGFTTGATGSALTYAFADGTTGDTLKIDKLSSFSGRILGFQAGDTIDLGGTLAVGTIVVKSDGRVLLENSAGTTLATLTLSSGQVNVGTFAVSGGIADGFTLTTAAGHDTLLTTNLVNAVFNNTSGSWQTGALWSSATQPGTLSSVLIGDGASSAFELTTGATPVQASSLSEVSGDATLQITSATTIGNFGTASTIDTNYGIQQISGDIEVTGGNTLTTTFLRQFENGATLNVDAGGVLDLIGHDNIGLVNNGTISLNTIVNGTTFANGNSTAAFINGTALVNGGTINAASVSSGGTTYPGGFISIGQGSGGTPATMTVEAGGVVSDTYAYLGSDPTSYGSLTLTGAGTTWDDVGDPTDTLNTRGYMIVGQDTQAGNQPSPSPAGTAQLLVENGATLVESLYALIGNSADSAGSATVTSNGIWNIGTSAIGGILTVGNGGSGTLTVSNGGTVNILPGTGSYVSNGTTVALGQGLELGHTGAGNGTVMVTGGGVLSIDLSSSAAGGVNVGQVGQGVMDIYSGGTVTITNSGLNVGRSLGAVGTLIVGGTGNTGIIGGGPGVAEAGGLNAVLATSGGGLNVGQSGTGTLMVETGGTIALTGGGINVGTSSGAQGLLEITGGAITSSTNGITVGGSAGTSGTLDMSGGNISLASGLLIGSGGTGTLNLNSGSISLANTFQVGAGQVTNITNTATANGTVTTTVTSTVTTSGGTGVGTIAGGNITTSSGGLNVGVGATGTLMLNAGSVSVTNNIQVGGADFQGTIQTNTVNGTIVSTTTLSGTQVAGTGTLIVAGGALSSTNGGLTVGSQGAGTLEVQAGGSVSATNGLLIAGNSAGGTGNVQVSGAGASITAEGFNIGNGGTGTLNVGVGGQVIANGGTTQGSSIGAGFGGPGSGTVIVNGGSVSENGSFFEVGGSNSSGTLLIENSGQFSTSNTSIFNGNTTFTGGAIGASGTGTAAATISGGTWTANGGLSIGSNGTGSVDINSGGVLNAPSGTVTVGTGTNGVGMLSVESGGTLQASGLMVGDAFSGTATGTVTVGVGGNAVVTTGIQLGTFTNSNGSLIVNGGTMSESGSGSFSIGGFNASGTLVVEGNGQLTSGNTQIIGGITTVTAGQISASGSGTAAANVTGGTWTANGQVFVGASGTGSLLIGSGGLVNAGTNSVTIGNGSNAAGTLTVASGGSLAAGVLSVASTFGGANVVGVVSVATGGTVSVASVSDDLGGTISVAGGSLAATGGITIGQGGTTGAAVLNIGNDGTVGHNGTVTDSGAFAIGSSSAGTVNVQTGGVLSVTGSNGFDIGQGAGETGTLNINGGAAASNGSFFGVGGVNASGTLIVQNSGQLTTTNAGPAGEINATGTGTASATVTTNGTWTVNGQLTVGDNGQGALTISSGGVVNVGTNNIGIGNQTGGAGTVTINGGTLEGSGLTIGGGTATGLLAVGTGGVVQLNSATINTGGTVNLAGGTFDPATPGISVNGSGVIEGYGVLLGNISLTPGTIGVVASGGTLIAEGSIIGTGTLGIASGSALNVQLQGNPVIAFEAGGSETLILGALSITSGGTTQMFSAVTGIATGDLIDFGANTVINSVSIANSGSVQNAFVSVTQLGTTGVIELDNIGFSGGTNQFTITTNGSTGDAAISAIQVATVRTLVWTGASSTNLGVAGNWNDLTDSLNPALTAAGTQDTAQFLANGGIVSGSDTVNIAQFGSGGLWSFGAGASLTAASGITVGSGVVAVGGGATLSSQGTLDTISGAGGQGAAVTVAGTNATWTSGGTLLIGNTGLGDLSVAGAGTVIANGATIANTSTAAGSAVSVTGTGSDWTVSGALIVGNAGAGSLAITAGGTVTAASLDAGVISSGSVEGTGQISLSGTHSDLAVTGNVIIGDAGSANLSILNGATLSAANLTIGSQGSGSGAALVSDRGSVLHLTGTLNVGTPQGVGELTIGPNATIIASKVVLNGQIVDEGGLLDPNEIDVTRENPISGFGTVGGLTDLIVNTGTIEAKAGSKTTQKTLTVEGTISGVGGLLQIDAGSTMVVTGPVGSGQTIVFGGTSAALVLGDVGEFAGTITTFGVGDELIVSGTSVVAESFVGNVLTLFANGGTVLGTVAFAPGAVTGGGTLSLDGSGGVTSVACFAAGTRLATALGEVLVEDLRDGDLVCTVLGGETAPVVWVGHRVVDCVRHPKPEVVWPVRIRAHAFGADVPRRDVYLSPDHAVYVNEVLIPVKHLVNGTTVAQVRPDTVTYYHVELASHDVVLADNLPAESYLETGDRANFANAGAVVRQFPDFSARAWEAMGCAPLVVSGRELEAARALVSGIAEATSAAA